MHSRVRTSEASDIAAIKGEMYIGGRIDSTSRRYGCRKRGAVEREGTEDLRERSRTLAIRFAMAPTRCNSFPRSADRFSRSLFIRRAPSRNDRCRRSDRSAGNVRGTILASEKRRLGRKFREPISDPSIPRGKSTNKTQGVYCGRSVGRWELPWKDRMSSRRCSGTRKLLTRAHRNRE